MIKKAIVGISSLILTKEEIELLKKHQPFGVILFKRNCQDEEQLINLTSSIKSIIPHTKILIDQEGGRVARLKAPNFLEFPAANTLTTEEQVYDNYFTMGKYLRKFDIDINCAPVADLFFPFADKIIGDRSFGNDIQKVIKFASSTAKGLTDAGIIPIMKHIPGHGRALADSHLELPIIDTDLATLEATDFAVFKALSNIPMAMTAHVVYNALDPKLPATISKRAIKYIREEIGFKNMLISDDINMKALQGDLTSLTHQVFDAGCDIVLHCSGIFKEMEEVLEASPQIQA